MTRSPAVDAAPRRRPAKRAYHHGDLRQALIDAAERLIGERGAGAFTLADACRAAGVSTAAPYRHFPDREALVGAVAGRGFERLSERIRVARDRHGEGSIEAIVAMGQAYVAFASDQRPLFELIWSRHVGELPREASEPAGKACFGTLLEGVDAYRRRHQLGAHDTVNMALPLWTLVHGAASLVLGRNIEAVAPAIDVDRMIDQTTRAYLAGLGSAGRPDPVTDGGPRRLAR